MMTPRKLSIITVSTALALAAVAGPVLANESGVAALEARVAALEAKLESLLAETTNTEDSPAAPQEAPAFQPAEHSLSFGGYIKLDAMWSDYSDGDLAPGSAGSQFYIPATIPVDGYRSEGPEADMQARESRINFKSKHRLANGDAASTFVELDFFVSPGGNERVSNSYNPRLRHAYVKYNDWLFGQTWSTFQDVGALPENIDFIGPSESTTFVRQAQVRYTKGPWEFSIENPETTVTPFGGGERIVADDGGIPDFVTRYTATLGNGYLKAAALIRQLSCEAVGVDDTETGLGISLSGKHLIGRDDIRWMATWGYGTGRYLGLNTANGVVLDENGELEAIDQWGAFVSYRHFWNDHWRSNFTYGYLSNDHDVTLTGFGETSEVYSIHANLLYEPTPGLTLGSEILFAERTLESGASGDMTRLLLSAKYAF
jgi:hypothetical protein